jgi:MFS family permease
MKKFVMLWASQAVSALGTAMSNYALIVWVYGQNGSAGDLARLSVFSLLPSILFCFVAGAIADRWDKRRIMLAADAFAALGTATILLLFSLNRLQIWHLYAISFLLSCMSAFQNPAAYVATSLLVPQKHYVRAGGLAALSGSAVAILAPALGGVVLALGGLRMVLLIDLGTFAVAFSTLLFGIRLPVIKTTEKAPKETFLKSCAVGLSFLKQHSALLRIILFFAGINLIAKMGSYGMLPALILARTGGDAGVLGAVEAAVGIGALVGSLLVTLAKPTRSRTRVVFLACGLSFVLGEPGLSLSRALPIWCIAALFSNIPMAFLNANLTAIMRTHIPIALQGRVFAARDTIQYSTIPIGLLLAGFLADDVLEPLMAGESALRQALAPLFGAGQGAGIAILFFIVGIVGAGMSFGALRNRAYRTLDRG